MVLLVIVVNLFYNVLFVCQSCLFVFFFFQQKEWYEHSNKEKKQMFIIIIIIVDDRLVEKGRNLLNIPLNP